MSDTTSFDKAIAVLLNAAENAENNAPIWDNENNPDQADLCWRVAESCRNAASVLAAGVEG